MDLKERYGPWAVIVGGSEGVGEHLARQLGLAGINIVLVARKPEPLAVTAAKVREESGAEVRTVQLNIAHDDFLERIREVADGLEVGLVVHNVGGAPYPGPLVEGSLKAALLPALTNPVAFTKLVHHFGKPMSDRGRGGILMIGSLGGSAGCYGMAAYSAAKAYNQILAEALWAELEPKGVHVLAFPLGATDTPARVRTGAVDTDDMPVARPEDVARQALEQLPHGPIYVAPENAEFFHMLCSMPRRDAALLQRETMTQSLPQVS